ncbi:ABC transporter ATP-binding protein [Lyticum sinuosum]|uniref:ABC transporter ATP-binding/permease protein n=1 Tax=Lyticum sinuosum TaxID=1332059 RepID=A0AAE5AHF7_9RICK|nr:ATP-binding cassette domain-containing protein [Lyticum sinuosum]MDZ5761520.1 ABC transporter ATP-binding/permease protein [Lyticum sinuosum]
MKFLSRKKVKSKREDILQKIISPYIKFFYIIMMAIFISSSSILGIGRILRHMIDNGFYHYNMDIINKSCFTMMILVVILTIGSIVRLYYINHIGNNLVSDIRCKLYSVIINMRSQDIDEIKHGNLISILLYDTEIIYNIITGSLSSAIRNLILAIGSIIMMFSTSPSLSVFTIISLPVIVTPIIILGSRSKKEAKRSKNISTEIFTETENSINNLHLIQSYARETFAEKKFSDLMMQKIIANKKHSIARSILVAIVLTLSFFGVIALIWLSGKEMICKNLTGGAVSSFLILLVICGSALGSVADSAPEIGRLFGLFEKIKNFINQYENYFIKNELTDKNINNNISIDSIQFKQNDKIEIVIKNLKFNYLTKICDSISDLSLTIESGKITAIVGESGSGKSTLVKLLLKLYDYSSGEIIYNGINLKDIPNNILREDIAYVSQDNYIFAGSIYNNIIYGRLDASEKEVDDAIRAAAAIDFINALPNGIMTNIGEKGIQLSGGQKQRICIARAILRKSRFIILDEATSSLDDYNENEVFFGIKNLLKNKTILIITHSLATILKSDKVIVLKDGLLVQEGKHNDLVKDLNGEYHRLLNNNKLFSKNTQTSD